MHRTTMGLGNTSTVESLYIIYNLDSFSQISRKLL